MKATASAAGFIAQRDMLRRQLADTRTTIQRLERELADKSAALNAAQREHDLAKSTYENFSKSYEGSRLSVAAQAAELKIVDPATPGRAAGQPEGDAQRGGRNDDGVHPRGIRDPVPRLPARGAPRAGLSGRVSASSRSIGRLEVVAMNRCVDRGRRPGW